MANLVTRGDGRNFTLSVRVGRLDGPRVTVSGHTARALAELMGCRSVTKSGERWAATVSTLRGLGIWIHAVPERLGGGSPRHTHYVLGVPVFVVAREPTPSVDGTRT